MNCSSPIRVIVVDDHAIVRSGITAFIQAHKELTLVGEAENGEEALALCARVVADVVLMDLTMPVMDGRVATQMIRQRYPDLPILILTSSSDYKSVTDVITAGATGYILKTGDIEDMAAAIISVHRGEPYLSSKIAQLLMTAVAKGDCGSLGDDLTKREQDVLQQMALGFTNRQIAAKLHIAITTVGFHVGNILSKLQVQSRTEAVAVALQHELVCLPKHSHG